MVRPPRAHVTPRLASTVLLLRDGADGLEVFVQRRAATMKFAPGMTVFPGGGVDQRDLLEGHEVPWSGRDLKWWSSHLGVGETEARALVLAAVRETFEETGTLLVPENRFQDVDRYRGRLESRDVSMSGFFLDKGLTVGSDLLRPWSNWVTPESSPIRYDTFFFLAARPEGQEPDGRNTESVESRWTTPEAILDQWRSREVKLLPPTWHQLMRLSELSSVAEALDIADAPVQRTVTDFLEQPFMAEYIEQMGEPPWR